MISVQAIQAPITQSPLWKMVNYSDSLPTHTNPSLLIINKLFILILLKIIIPEPSAPPNNVEAIDIDTHQVTIRWKVSSY